jgi:hypothetical protein
MALPGDLAFTIKFDLTNSPANFENEDTTPYGALGVALDDVRGVFTNVTDPLGNVIHNNTDFDNPDLLPASSLLYTGLNIPTDVNGDIITGQYSFTYNIKTDNPITAVNQGGKIFTIAGDFVTALSAATTIDVVRSTGNNGTFTIASVALVGGDTEITVVEVIPSGTADGSIQYSTQAVYSKTQTVTFVNSIPAISIEVETDCFCGLLKSIDKTNYGTATILSRTHTVMYPAALQIADIVSSNATVTVTPIYTKTWTTKIESDISIDLGGGNTIQATIVGSQDTKVDCDLTLCEISCCVIAMNNRYLDARISNPPLAAKYFADLTRVMQLIEMFQMATACGQNNVAQDALNEIKKVGNCQDTCRCDDDQPQIVVPLCSSGANCVNVTAGTGVVVNTTFANNCYTYQISISPSVMQMINAATPTSLTAGTGISVSSAVIGGVTVWTITNTAPYVEQNRLEFLSRIQYTSAPTAVNITNSNYLKSGSNMNATATVANTTIATANGANKNNVFKVSAFQVANNNNYKVTIEPVLLVYVNAGAGDAINAVSAQPLELDIISKSSGEFTFRFTNEKDLPLTNNSMTFTTDIIVNIKISE